MARDLKYGQVTTQRKNIPPGEPVFLFRAQDPLAEKYVRMYAEDYRFTTGDNAGYRKILLQADNFRLWPTKKEMPDS